MNTNDRRIRKTKKALREALAKLLTEKELHTITVQELQKKRTFTVALSTPTIRMCMTCFAKLRTA